jgi:hypothetical protein
MVAGLLFGVATLVKFVALVAMAALAMSVWRASGRRAFCLLVGTGGAVALAGYAVAGGTVAIRPLMIASAWHSSQSLATGILKLGARVDAPLICEIAAAAAIGARLLRRPPSAAWIVAAALALYVMAAPWVLPWYVAWELPVAALVWRTPLGFVVTLQSALLCIASVNATAVNPVIFHDAVTGAAHVLLPVLDVVGLVVLGFTDWLAPRADRADPGPSPVAVAHS